MTTKERQPETPPFPVPYPRHPSEAEIQAELLRVLWKDGHDARANVRLRPQKGYRGARFDIAIFVDKNAVALIEVKRGLFRKRQPTKSAQAERYRLLTGLPTFICRGWDAIGPLLDRLYPYLNGRHP